MKKKTTTKKRLLLSKETIVHLEAQGDLKRVAGGSIISSDNEECTFTKLGFETTCWC